MAYKLQVIINNKGNVWSMPAMDLAAWKAQGIEGVYICAGVGNTDNKFIEPMYDQCVRNGMRVGFYRILDEVESYWWQMDDLRQKSTVRGYSLPPALIIGNLPKTTNSWVFREDFTGEGMGYFMNTLINKFPTVVLGINPGLLQFVLSAGEPPSEKDNNLELFKLQIKQAKLWYWKYNGPLVDMKEILPWSSVWILSNQSGHVVDPGGVNPDPPEPPQPGENDDLVMAGHFQAIADIFKKRGTV